MKKNYIKFTVTILCVIILLVISTAAFDYFRVRNAEKPIFTIPITADDGGTGTYYGLGYSIEIKGNFMPEDPLPGVKYYKYSILGKPVEETFFE